MVHSTYKRAPLRVGAASSAATEGAGAKVIEGNGSGEGNRGAAGVQIGGGAGSMDVQSKCMGSKAGPQGVHERFTGTEAEPESRTKRRQASMEEVHHDPCNLGSEKQRNRTCWSGAGPSKLVVSALSTVLYQHTQFASNFETPKP